MADTTEKVLISIEIEKPEGEKQIDALTRKITDLQKATAALQKENNELIKAGKENSDQYVENTRQIELNKQKINEAVSSRKGLIQTLGAEENSIKALTVRNGELRKERDLLSTSTEAGRTRIAAINAEMDKNNKAIKDNVSAQEKQRLGVGGYTEALDKLVPGLGATTAGIQSATKAALTFIATPLGAILAALGVAIAAVTAYFKGSEEGQNKFNKLAAVGSAIIEQFTNVLEDLGEFLVSVFENPGQALEDFGNAILENIVNRFIGLLELIPNIGKAVELLFAGEFAAAGEVAFDAVAKVVTGVDGATKKIGALIDETIRLVDAGVVAGQRIADLTAQIDRDERKLIVDRQKTALEVARLREAALQQESEARKKVLLEAIALEEQLTDREVELAKTRLALAQATLQANGDDKEALKEVAQARADVFTAETTAFQNTLRFRKEIRAIDEEAAKLIAKENEELQKALDDAHKEEMKRHEREREAINLTQELRLQNDVDRALSIEERVDKEIELEQFKVFALLENEALLEAEKQLIIEQSQKKINDIIVKGTADRVKREELEEKKLADTRKKVQSDHERGAFAVANATVGFAKAAFGENKAIAIAEATINTIQGVVRALKDYIFPYSLIVGALVGAAGAVNISKIASTDFGLGGLIKRFAGGGVLRKISATGGIARGPLHRDGGIPFTIRGQGGYEMEGNEAIINGRSTRMFKPLLSAINQAGGGVAFARGGVTRYQTGAIVGTQTRQASQQSESRTFVRDSVRAAMESMPPIIATIEDINARQDEVAQQTNKALII